MEGLDYYRHTKGLDRGLEMNIRDKYDPSTHVLEGKNNTWEWVDNVAIGKDGYYFVMDDGELLLILNDDCQKINKLIPKPHEPINLPTEISDKWQWAAMDIHNQWVLFKEQPTYGASGLWCTVYARPGFPLDKDLFDISTDIPWDKSLHKRNPDGTWSLVGGE